MFEYDFVPPWLLRNGFLMTLYAALRMGRNWAQSTKESEPDYQAHVFSGAGNTPIFGLMAQPKGIVRGTIIATYGITGTLENQWYLRLLGRKAMAQNYSVVLFDWRGHGETAQLSPALTSDGIYEGEDFVRIAAQAKAMGYAAPFWFAGYSLGGQLALWGVRAAELLETWGIDLDLMSTDIGGGFVICPSVESSRSLAALRSTLKGRLVEQSIVKQLRIMVQQIVDRHPGSLEQSRIDQVNTIRGFDHELVIDPLGFATTEAYYRATSPLYFLPELKKPTLIIYAADDPLFDPNLVSEISDIAVQNPALDLCVTQYGGHVGYLSSKQCQIQFGDPDRWWAWNRILEWLDQQHPHQSQAGLKLAQSRSEKR